MDAWIERLKQEDEKMLKGNNFEDVFSWDAFKALLDCDGLQNWLRCNIAFTSWFH